MKKRMLFGLVGLSLLALASCGKPTPTGGQTGGTTGGVEMPSLEGKTINMYLNYKGTTGVTFTGKYAKVGTSYKNPIDGITYTEGTLLPMWSQVEENLGITIKDAVPTFVGDAYTQTNEDGVYTAISGDANLSSIDILMTNSANANKYSSAGQLVDLAAYLDYMPNLSAFLDSHQAIKEELTNADGEMYIAPYFDGVDTIEKMFIFNTELVEMLLDDDNASYDTVEIANGGKYEAYIDTATDYKIQISVNGQAKDMTVKAAKNPITAQNELATKSGKTYVEALKAYIDAAYMPSGNYEKRSEVFTSEKACYNVDDMIALMRCAVNNSTYLYGEPGKVQGIIPRGQANNRVITILQFAQVWGVQGLTAETDYLYYNDEGKLCDARTTAKTYEALDKLHQLKEEGLIVDGWDAAGSKNGTYYTSAYLSGRDGAALMIYDYNATQTVWNKVDENGIGQSDAKYDGIRPVLPPVTNWENNNISGSEYKYTRYTEDARAFKGSGSVVLAKEDEAQIIAACQVIDYFYGEEGADLQDYGPEGYTDGTITVAGKVYPKINPIIFQDEKFKSAGWNDWYRACVGSTQGIGHVRSDGLDYQVTHAAGKQGLENIMNAISSGALICATTARTKTFGATVPAKWDETPVTTNITDLVDFWKQGMNDTHWRSVINHGWTNEVISKADLEALWGPSNQGYLKFYQDLLA